MERSVLVIPMLAFFALILQNVHGHGRLMDPPGRNAMWRYGYPTPVNYDDAELWCGGAANYTLNGEKCGVCGDNYVKPTPRDHEAGGKFGLGLVVRRYSKGQTFEADIELTTNHKGYFYFKLCPVPDSTKEVTQECLDENPLQIVNEDGSTSDKYFILTEEMKPNFSLSLLLPKEVTCTHCVLQWTYVAANTWGVCANGTEAVGCGPQETFVNCADIAILTNDGARPPSATQVPPKNMVLVRDSSSGNLIPLVVRTNVCVGSGSYESQPGINEWCQENCMRYPPNCPEDKCRCYESCEPTGSFKNETGADVYCQHYCYKHSPKNCIKERCECQ